LRQRKGGGEGAKGQYKNWRLKKRRKIKQTIDINRAEGVASNKCG